MILFLWTNFKAKMQCQRGFVITAAVAGSALVIGAVGGIGLTGAVATAATWAVGAGVAAAVYGAAAWGVSALMSGGESAPGQQQQAGFDYAAQDRAAKATADEKTKRTRIASARNKGMLNSGEEAKLGTTGLLGAY